MVQVENIWRCEDREREQMLCGQCESEEQTSGGNKHSSVLKLLHRTRHTSTTRTMLQDCHGNTQGHLMKHITQEALGF